MGNTKKNIVLLLLSFVLVFAAFVFINTDYSYAASKTPAKVTGLKIKKCDTTKVQLSWKKAKNAKKYKVYRWHTGDDKFSCVKTTTSTSAKFKQTKGRYYIYKVRAVNGNTKGKYSAEKYYLIKTSDIHVTCPVNEVTVGEEKQVIVFNVSYNDDFTFSHSSIISTNYDHVWEGKQHLIYCYITSKSQGETDLTITVDDEVSCTVKVTSTYTKQGLGNPTYLLLTYPTPQTVKVNCGKSINVDVWIYSNGCFEKTNASFVNGTLTLTIKPLKKGSGSIRVMDTFSGLELCNMLVHVAT